MRKTNPARLFARRPDGIFVAPFEEGEIGPDRFLSRLPKVLEGLVAKHRDRPYQAGRSKHWLKVRAGFVRDGTGAEVQRMLMSAVGVSRHRATPRK